MNRGAPAPLAAQDNPLWISWHDTTWIPILHPGNVMDYFQEKSNPFYDRTCNNENVKMQRVGVEQLAGMTGVEYILLHVQEPILYVIRKQHRHSPAEVTPMADYYIIAGTVYQAPDLANVFNSRLLTVTQHLQSSFEETSGYARYHPNRGYGWDFSSNKALADRSKAAKKDADKAKEEPSSFFQRKRVDMLLGELLNKFPLPMPPTAGGQPTAAASAATSTTTTSPTATTTATAPSGTATAAAPNVAATATAPTTTTTATAVPKSSPVVAAVTGAGSNGIGSHHGASPLTQTLGANHDPDAAAVAEIKQERMDTLSPPADAAMLLADGDPNKLAEPTSDMKPPPEKKTKLM